MANNCLLVIVCKTFKQRNVVKNVKTVRFWLQLTAYPEFWTKLLKDIQAIRKAKPEAVELGTCG